MTFAQFRDKWLGRRCQSGQCVALFRRYVAEVVEKNSDGFNTIPSVVSAKDIWTAAPKKHWQHVKHRIIDQGKHEEETVPTKGAIVVFKATSSNPHGHVGIATGRLNLKAGTFEVLEQNFGVPLKTTLGFHGYGSVIGWLYRR